MTVSVPSRFMLYSPHYGKVVFVSNDADEPPVGDRIVEAHDKPIGDDRNWFEVQPDQHGNYLLYNPATSKYVFISSTKDAGDRVVEARSNTGGDPRFSFSFEKGDAEGLFCIYSPSESLYLFVSETLKAGDNQVEAHGKEERSNFQLLIPYK